MSDIMTPAAVLKQAREAMTRAAELLNATARFMDANPIAAEYTINYDEAQCDGGCLAADCTTSYEEIATALAAIDALPEDGWIVWKQDDSDDEGEYPPDETDVEIYCGRWQSKDRLIGRTSRARGTGGPIGASHWRSLAPPPEPPQ